MKLLNLALGMLLTGLVHGQIVKKYSNEFLSIGAGARALALGGAQVASSGDGYSSYWNPAGLTKVNGPVMISAQHAEYFSGIGKYDFVSLIKPIGDSNTSIGVSFLRFAVDDIANTLFLVNPDGSIDYNNVSAFSAADYAVLLSFAKQIRKVKGDDEENARIIDVGGNAKIIRRTVGSFARSWGFGFDLGIKMQIRKKWGFGAVLRDATSTFNTWSFTFTDREQEVLFRTDNEIPTKSTELTAPKLSTGLYRDFQLDDKLRLRAETNLDITFDGKRNNILNAGPVSFSPRIGTELIFAETVSLRGGLTNLQRAFTDNDLNAFRKVWTFQPSFGVGVKFKGVVLDYAFVNLANQSKPLYTHVFSVSFGLVKKNNEEE